MKQKQNIIILAILGIIFLLFWLVVITLVLKGLRGSSNEVSTPVVINVTLCDENASGLCIVTFGANNLNRMVIHFQLPAANYAPFYVKATNRGMVSVYTCEVDKAVPTSAHCTGVRTPLGEMIDIEVYTTDEDKLIARGTFLVSAIAIDTPISLPTKAPIQGAPTGVSTPVPTLDVVPLPFPQHQ